VDARAVGCAGVILMRFCLNHLQVVPERHVCSGFFMHKNFGCAIIDVINSEV